MLLIQGPHFNKKSLSSSVTKHFTYTSKSIQLNSVHLQGTPLSDSENPAYLGLIICWPGVKQSSTMKLIFRFSFFPFIFHFFLFVLMKSGEQFKKKKKLEKVTSKILLGGPNVYPAARVASCWIRPWQRLMGSDFSTLESRLHAIHGDWTRTM